MSVVVPTFNRSALLREAVASVRRQTWSWWGLLVVDDGSTDDTLAMLAGLGEPRLRSIHLDHYGSPARVRNAALAVARGDYVAFLDDDDLWEPAKLATQVPLLADGRYRWSYTGFSRVGAGAPPWRCPPDRLRSGCILLPLLAMEAAVALPTVVAERALLAEAGGFDETMESREDYALWLELARRAPVVAVTEPLTTVRDHPGRVRNPRSSHLLTAAVYRRLRRSLRDAAARRLCRRRLAEVYVAEAGRLLAGGRWWRTPAPLLAALAWHPRAAWRRVTAALRRRVAH